MRSLSKHLPVINKALWACLLLALPVTSFPFFPIPGMQGALVRPLALYPLGFLAISLLFFHMIEDGRLPRAVLPLTGFVLVAALATLWAFFDPNLPLHGATVSARALRGFATLGIGICFFLVTVLMVGDEERLKFSGRVLAVAYTLSVIWCVLQYTSQNYNQPGFEQLNQLHRFFSVRDLHSSRIHGFAFEPSWLGAQLAIFILPFFLAARLAGYQILGKHWTGAAAEWLLIGANIVTLAWSYSRSGLAIFVGAALLGIGVRTIIWLLERRSRVRPSSAKTERSRWAGIVFLIVLMLVLGWVFIEILSRNGYFRLLWEKVLTARSFKDYMLEIGGAPRLAYTEAAFRTFLQFPIIGSGLGQSGFHIFDNLPNWSLYGEGEITHLLSPTWSLFPNPKNLWARLLAETGITGMLFYVVFLINVLSDGIRNHLPGKSARVFMICFGIMGWAAILVEGYFLDSFALPTMWIVLGIITGSGWNSDRRPKEATL